MEDLIRNLYNTFGYAGIVIAMAIESCCIPLPSELIMPLAGALTVSSVAQNLKISHTFSLWGVTLAGAVGCVIGSIIAYAIGATGGRELLLRYGKYILISRRDVERAEAFFARRGDITILISRIMPIVRTFISLPAGMVRMNFPRFVIFTFIGSLPWCFVLALAGQQLGQHWTDVGNTLRKYEYVVIAVFVILVALYIYRHVREERTHPSVQ
ncbi:MAG TPA: DedA family protein [Chloroflexota bacterium]|nr:DedA family protein [Chloroflexota bacterium]